MVWKANVRYSSNQFCPILSLVDLCSGPCIDLVFLCFRSPRQRTYRQCGFHGTHKLIVLVFNFLKLMLAGYSIVQHGSVS